MASKKCKNCEQFEILREASADKVGVAICDKYGMIANYLFEKQIEDLCCGDMAGSPNDKVVN